MALETKFKNDKHFEERIVQALIVDHQWAEQMREVLDLNYFNLDYLQETTKILFEYYDKYQAFPSFKLLGSIVKDISNELLRSQVITYLIKIKKEPLNGDMEYVKEQSLDFCKRRALACALEDTLDLIENKKYDQILPGLQKAILAGSDKDVGHMFLDHFEKRQEVIKRNVVPTPWEEMNKVMNGGLGGGELGVIMAGTGVGKSHTLVDIGFAAAMNGLNVVHYTLELGDIYVGKRYDSRAAAVNFDNLQENKGKIEAAVKKIPGSIVIKAFPAKSVTVLGLKNHINQLFLRDMKPDVIIVDSCDLMRSSRNYDQKRMEEEHIYEEFRAYLQEIDLPGWTVTQSNREGLDLDVITLKNVSECIGKAFTADFFATMTRKKENTQITVGNLFVAKSRIGFDGMKFPILVTTAQSKIEVLNSEIATDDDSSEKSVHDLLREQFRKFQKNGGQVEKQ